MAVVITDAQGYIEWVNEGFTRITEYELAEVIGKKPGQVLQGADTDPEIVKILREGIAQQKPVLVEIVNYSKSGKKYWLQLDIIPVFDQGKLVHFVGFETDITEKKEQTHRMQQTTQMLEEMIYVNSHEIRRPVANIRGLISLMEQRSRDEEDAHLLDLLRESVHQLDSILYNMLPKKDLQ